MKSCRRKSRRGVAIIIVLAMISIAMAVSYAMLRSQSVSIQVQANGDRRGLAHNAAMAGLAAGLRRMHLNSWTGVNTTITGSLDTYNSYSVTFTAGDDSLSTSSANYDDWHYRVTIVSTGTSRSQANSQVKSSSQVKAVVQLVPKQLATEPTNWSQVRTNTVYQTNTGQFSIDVPGRIEGNLRLQGTVTLGANYNWSTTARSRYLSDLNQIRTARNEVQTVGLTGGSGTYRLAFNGSTTSNISSGASASSVQTALRGLTTIGNGNVNVSGNSGGPYTVTFVNALGNQSLPMMSASSVALSGGNTLNIIEATQGWPGYADCRPVTGPISLPISSTDSTNQGLLTSLGVSTTNISVSTPMSISFPTSLPTYRLYPGGPTYNVPLVPTNLSNIALAPNPTTNPLGIYYSNNTVTLGNNVSINGTLISKSGVNISGSNVAFTPVDLRPLTGSSTPIRLPAAVVNQVFFVDNSVSAAINGFLVVGQQFLIERGSSSASFALTGRLITNELIVRRRSDWDFASIVWSTLWTLFNSQAGSSTGTPYYPLYLNASGLNLNPLLTIRPDASVLAEHWQDLSQPIYVAATGDPGLCWDVVRVVLNP